MPRLCILFALSVLLVVHAGRSTCVAAGDKETPVCSGDYPIQHLLVLMMENRSFDHMLGFLKRLKPEIRGLTGQEFNYLNPAAPSDASKVFVNDLAQNVDPDFDHSVDGTSQEIQWGAAGNDQVTQALMNGFAAQGVRHVGAADGPLALSMFNETTLPVLSSLALNFALIDGWFADIPGPTMPNRFFFMSGTSHGMADNDDALIALGLPQQSIFDRLDQWNVSWRVYAESVPSALGLRRMRLPHNLDKVRDVHELAWALKYRELPTFSWIEPSYFDSPELDLVPRDQHPDHQIVYGEQLIKEVYDALRQSPYWNCSALLVTYDEHGGFADFEPTETSGVPNPDGRDSRAPPFNFQRLGIRVPAVLVSPWVDPVVVHESPDKPANNSRYSHSSLAATLQKLFDPSGPQLTQRTAWSSPFDSIWMQRSSPRTDAPIAAPPPYQTNFYRNKPRHSAADLPLNGFQRELMIIARHTCLANPHACKLDMPSVASIEAMTERQAAALQHQILTSLTSIGRHRIQQ